MVSVQVHNDWAVALWLCVCVCVHACVSACVRVLSESSFPGCFLFRSRGVFHFLPALPQSLVRLPSCLPALWNLLCMTVYVGVCPCAEESVWNVCTCRCSWGWHTEKCDTGASLLCFDVAFALHAQNYRLAPLRSETDKGRHEVTFPHSDVTACENPVAQQLLSLLSSNVYQSLSFSPLSLIKPNWPDFVLRHWYSASGYRVNAEALLLTNRARQKKVQAKKKKYLASCLCG